MFKRLNVGTYFYICINMKYMLRHLPFFKTYTRSTNVAPCAHRSSTTSMVNRTCHCRDGRSPFQLHFWREVDLGRTSRGWPFSRLSTTGKLHFKGCVLWRLFEFSFTAVAGHGEGFISVARADATGGAAGRATLVAVAFPFASQPRRSFDSTQ